MNNNILEMLIRRSRQATPPVTEWNSYFPKQASDGRAIAQMRFAIEKGRLVTGVFGTASTAGYTGVIGESDQWTCVTDAYDRETGYGICDGVAYLINQYDLTATSLDMPATYVAGSYYTDTTYGNIYGLLCNSNGLYRLEGTTATLINAKGDWVEIGSGVGEPNTQNDLRPFALDSTGTVYTIAYDGTLEQQATGMSAISAGIRNYEGFTTGYYGNVSEITFYQGSITVQNYNFYIYNGALYRLQNVRNQAHNPLVTGGVSGTLVDDTGTWTSVYVKGNYGYGVRNGVLCNVSSSGYSEVGVSTPAWKAGYNSFIGRDDGYIYFWKNNWGRFTDL